MKPAGSLDSREEPTAKAVGFFRCAVNGNGLTKKKMQAIFAFVKPLNRPPGKAN